MLSAGQLKNGVVFEYQGTVYQVITYKHTHISRGGADIKVKARDLVKGAVLNLTIQPSAKFEEADIRHQKLQFLYQDGDDYYFMNQTSFEQLTIDAGMLGEPAKFLKEGEEATVIFWEDQAISLDLPVSLIYKIQETSPNEKGDSTSNMYKPATLVNGLEVKVPLFIKAGDKVKVDTRTGQYLERVK